MRRAGPQAGSDDAAGGCPAPDTPAREKERFVLGDPRHLTAYREKYTGALFDAVCGQVHLATAKPDPDVDGIDREVKFRFLPVGVQIKATAGRRFNRNGELKFPIEQKWVDAWSECQFPPRLVLYVIPKDPARWITLNQQSQTHHVRAYWAPLPPTVSVPSVTIKQENEFSAATLREWRDEVTRALGGRP